MRMLLLAMLAVAACNERSNRGIPPAAPRVGEAATPSGHGAGRDRWRGGGVYVDGTPIGVLRHAELPARLAPIWETRRHRLAFQPGEPVRYAETKVPRYRVTDYLRALGVDLDRVVQLHLHGARDSAIVLTGADLRRHADDVLFKFAGDTSGKPIPIVREIPIGTSFDDLSAMTIYIERTPPALTADQTLELDGRPVRNIPYYGEPLREGVRIYVDDRLVTVLKRNQLAAGPASLGATLDRLGIATSKLARLELIHDEARTARLAWSDVEFEFNQAASGEILLGKGGLKAHSLALYSSARASRIP